ncbi:MAG: DEAD/DEAH box helicase [Halobacteriota archaeon]
MRGRATSIESILKTLQDDHAFRDKVAHIEVLPARKPEYDEGELELSPKVKAYLQHNAITLYSHQSDAVALLRSGEDIVITTPTASGKTLAFNVPVFEALDNDPQATALYLYPTKALSHDQLKALKEFEHISGISVNPNVYDGDTPAHKRPAIRTTSRVVISNPYELHHILPWHYKWQRFLTNLRFIVLDEAHVYRGVFGSNVAFLIRRLRRLCAHYGARPQIVISTATLANPREFGERLTGATPQLISRDGAPRARKYFVLYNPYAVRRGARSSHQEAKDLFLYFLRSGLHTLCFTKSRKMAELIALWARNDASESDPLLADRISAYRAGYLPAARRSIEERLKTGALMGITSTNALELGIDIGSLDAVIMAGYPGTIISTWQQAGRAGRGNEESIATLVGFHDPLDQYFMRHPLSFFNESHEHAIIDLSNEHIALGHTMCAAAELPVRPAEDALHFSVPLQGLLDELQRQGLVKETPSGWVYSGRGRATEAVPLNSLSSTAFKVMCDGRLIETLDTPRAYREAHQGAILLHQSETYVVESFNVKSGIIDVKRADVDYYTEPLTTVDLRVVRELHTASKGALTVSHGIVEVIEQFVGYKVLRYNQVLAAESLDLPALRFTTAGVWLTLPDASIAHVTERGLDAAGGLHGAEHALIAMMPLHVMCDRWDIGGVSTLFHPDTVGPSIFIYDAFEGGIGLAEKAFELIADLVTTTRELVGGCACDVGCPACIYSPKCGNENTPLDKEATKLLLSQLEGYIGD